jgi:hypothetical protein
MGFVLTDHADVLLRARAAVAFVEDKIEQQQASGELAWFNQAYREWRLAAKAEGRSMTYAEARARLRRHNFSRSAVVRVRRSFKIHFPSAANIKFGLTASNRGCSPHARRRGSRCEHRYNNVTPYEPASNEAGFFMGPIR